MSDLSKLRIWNDPAIHNALSWYLDVAENRRPAKFRIAATVAASVRGSVSSPLSLSVLMSPFWQKAQRILQEVKKIVPEPSVPR